MSAGTPRLVRLPLPASAEEYQRAADELETRLGELPGVIAVYRTGSVTAPGISDLDRVAVVEPDGPLPDLWPSLSPRTRYLAMHAPFAVDVATFARHRWFAGLDPLELASGRPLELEEPPDPEHGEPQLAAEAMVIALLSLMKQSTCGRVKVRPLLCELHNVRCSLALARLPRQAAPAAWALTDDVGRIRSAWWELPAPERTRAVRRLIARGPAALEEALRALSARLDGREPPETLQLRGSWSNVTLVRADRRARTARSAVPRAFGALSGRLAEARWRLARREIALSPSLLELLSGGAAAGPFAAERQGIVRRYQEFAARDATGYSSIGLAGAFVP